MSAKDLVLDALPDDIGKPALDAMDVLRSGPELEASNLLEYLQDAQKSLEEAREIWQRVSLFIALAERSMASEPETGLLGMLLETRQAEDGCPDAIESLQKKLDAMKADLQEEIYQEGRDTAAYGWDAAVEYIHGLWGEDALSVMSEATGSQPQTARRWLQGGCSTYTNSRRIQTLAGLAYDLQHRLDWDPAQVRMWMHTPLAGGKSPLTLWQQSRYFRPPAEVEAEIKRLGIIS